jgi:hypothetical protein
MCDAGRNIGSTYGIHQQHMKNTIAARRCHRKKGTITLTIETVSISHGEVYMPYLIYPTGKLVKHNSLPQVIGKAPKSEPYGEQ